MPVKILPVKGQDWLIKLMLDFGYSIDKDGLCYGVAYMALQAYLADELKLYFQRLQYAYLNRDKLSGDGNISGKNVDDEKDTSYNTTIFFQGITLYQFTEKHKHLFEADNQPSNQSSKHVLPLISPVNLDKHGKIVQYSSVYGMYSRDELGVLLAKIKQQLDLIEVKNQKIGWILNGHEHTNFLGYDSNMCTWHLVDTNRFMDDFKDIDELVDYIFSYFHCDLSAADQEEAEYISLNILSYGKGCQQDKNLNLINDIFSSLEVKNLHILTHEKLAQVDSYYNSLLHLAAESGDEKIFREIARTAELHDCLEEIDLNYTGFTPFSFAVEQNHIALCQYLLTEPLYLNLLHHQWSDYYVHLAADLDHADMVTFLLGHDLFEPNELNLKKLTPLCCAIRNNSKRAFIELLKDSRIDPNKKDGYGRPPILFAATKKDTAYFEMLMQHPDINPNVLFAKNGKYLIHYVIERSSINILEALLRHPAIDVNIKEKIHDAAPLHHAIVHNYQNAVELLINHSSIDIEALDVELESPLSRAIKCGNHSAMKILLSANAEINFAVGFRKISPMQLAQRLNDEQAQNLLLSEEENRKTVKLNKKRQRPLEEIFPCKKQKYSNPKNDIDFQSSKPNNKN